MVDGVDERQPASARLKPIVATAVELDEQARLGHPVAPAAMAPRRSMARARTTGCAEDPLDGGAPEDQPLLGEQIDKVAVVGALEPAAGQVDDPSANRVVQASRWRPTAIAVDQARGSVGQEAALEAPDRSLGQPEQGGRLLGHRQRARHDSRHHHRPSLFFDRHRDPPHLGETDKVIEQLVLTESRSNNMRRPPSSTPGVD